MSLVNWEKVFLPKSHGGLNIRSIKNMNKALLAKINWNLVHSHKEWGTIMQAKYYMVLTILVSFIRRRFLRAQLFGTKC